MKEFRFRSIHSILADTEDEAREILKAQADDFVNNAVVFQVEDMGKTKEQEESCTQ